MFDEMPQQKTLQERDKMKYQKMHKQKKQLWYFAAGLFLIKRKYLTSEECYTAISGHESTNIWVAPKYPKLWTFFN